MDDTLRYTLIALLITLGVGSAVAGLVSFRLARTTMSPLHPERSSRLVRSGIYRLTRNPMYLGWLLVVLAWGVFLQSTWALLGPVLFFLWINYLQIVPEERFLQQLFGESYAQYRHQVRRWI
jgi:protein-S-isoprenylcysteine O-methyltransferase Ste14